MINSALKSMAMVFLVVAFTSGASCREEKKQPGSHESAVVTVAFKMPVSAPPYSAVSPVDKKKKVTTGVKKPEKRKEKHPNNLPEPLGGDFGTPLYSADGRVNPFIPLIKAENTSSADAGEKEKKPARFLTPLEKLDYSQMQLVAVVGRKKGYTAMVQEAGGKGYIVTPGTFMGRNGGQVSKILQDRIIVVERVKDYKGDMITRTQEIKLNKMEEGGL